MIGNMFFYILYNIGYFISNVLPLRVVYWIADVLSDLRYFVATKDRNAVTENLSIVLKKDIKECRILARKVFRNFGLYLVDFFRMLKLDKETIKNRVVFQGLEKVDRVLKEKKGIVFLTCHIGNWEMGGVTMGILGYDISCVALIHKHKKINDFFLRQREEKGLKVINIKASMKKCITVLLRKGLLALAGDRDFTNSGIMLDFFGVKTSIPKGPALLSLKTHSAIVPVFFLRKNRFNYEMIFEDPIYVKNMPGVEEDEVVKKATENLVPIMEKYIREYPEQWLVFRRFWEDLGDSFVL